MLNSSEDALEFETFLFKDYFDAWIEIATNGADPRNILNYRDVPFVYANEQGFHRQDDEDAVVTGLVISQQQVIASGYSGSHVLDRSTTAFNHNAASIRAIFSRYDGAGAEIERGAYQFTINRTTRGLRMTSAATLVTTVNKLPEIGW